ncbi:MAG: hypothetical protein BIFFINMI_00748 [Phycisphaerae bacterium]|nr:hypothetical protein [Phycisphaerae bacterium]
MARLREIELTGPPARMGEAFGEAFRDDIRAFTRIRFDRLAKFVADNGGRGISRSQIVALAAGALGAHRSYDADLWAEFAGIARGAGLDVEELLVCNGLTDLRDLALMDRRGAAGDDPDECSMFMVPAELSGETGLPLCGQTWDMHFEAMDYMALVRRRPDNAPATLSLTTVGCLCLIGQNSEGVAVGNTNLVPTDPAPGVNYLFTITRALRAGDAAEAADLIQATPRLSGHNFYAVDARSAVNIETTATRCVRTPVGGAVFTHTNHYLSEELRPLEFTDRAMANTRWRQETLTCALAALAPPIRLADAWDRLARVTQGPGGACAAAGVSAGPDSATVAAIAQCPGAGRMWLCIGPPTPGNRREFTL